VLTLSFNLEPLSRPIGVVNVRGRL
jgi:hypothetical protein